MRTLLVNLAAALGIAACGGSSGSNDLFVGPSSSVGSASGGTGAGLGGAAAASAPGVACGASVSCGSNDQVCCALNVAAGIPKLGCKPSAAACDGMPIACDDGGDCPGQTCCGRFDATLGYTAVSCMPTCSGSFDGGTFVRFCNPRAEPDECASENRTCRPSASLVGYYRCE